MNDIRAQRSVDAATASFIVTINGRSVSATAEPLQRTSDFLRDQGLLATKVGCDAGDCGACTILLNGEPACACLVPAAQLADANVLTAEADDPVLAELREAFLQTGAAQCGICTPGMLMSAASLIQRAARRQAELTGKNDTATQAVDRQSIKDALGGVLCRCTGYAKIIDAVFLVAVKRQLADACDVAHAALPDNARLTDKPSAVGARISRLDGLPKVRGTEKFGADVIPSDALRLKIIRSPYHSASFTLGDTQTWAKSTPGIALVISAEDIKGVNRFGVIPGFTDQPVFAEHKTHFRGEAVAAVVGDRQAISALRDDAFPITWQELAAVTDPLQALESDPVIDGRKNNILVEGLVQRGEASASLESVDCLVSGSFKTRHVEHAYIEPEAGFAQRVGDRIEVYTCTQTAGMTQESLAEILGIEKSQVRVIPTAVGGGFGSKLDLSIQPALCIAASLLDQPVGGIYTRTESMQSTTKRHPSDMQVAIGCNKNGKLEAIDFFGVFNTGSYASWGPTVANRVPVHASGPYYVPNYKAHTKAVTTNVVPAGAFRGFGVPQAAFAVESLLDQLAEKISIDRLQFRLDNAIRNDQPTVTGQVFNQGVGIADCLEALIPAWQNALYQAKQHNLSDSIVKRGVGVASCWYGCGNTSLPNPSTIKIGLKPSGEIVLHQGAIDLGQGSNTVITQMVADALGVNLSMINLVGADTDLTPDAGKTSASRQTFVTGNAAIASANALRQQLLRCVNASEDSHFEFIIDAVLVKDAGTEHRIDLQALAKGSEYVFEAQETYNPDVGALDNNGQGIPYAQYGYGAQVVELLVDTELGTVKLEKITTAHDVGCAINPQLIEGQIEGGATQGIGMALMEEFEPGRIENLHDYLIPTIGDIPEFEHHIIEVPDAEGPYGAKGLGEHVLIPTAPAIINAITHACGAELRELPATPARVRAAILKHNGQSV